MFHIVFNADENYIKYTAVLINSIIKNTDKNKKFEDFFADTNLNANLNLSANLNSNLALNSNLVINANLATGGGGI